MTVQRKQKAFCNCKVVGYGLPTGLLAAVHSHNFLPPLVRAAVSQDSEPEESLAVLDHVQVQLKFILVGVEKCSEIRSWEDPLERWDSSMGLCITAGILWAEVTNPVLAQFLVSAFLDYRVHTELSVSFCHVRELHIGENSCHSPGSYWVIQELIFVGVAFWKGGF